MKKLYFLIFYIFLVYFLLTSHKIANATTLLQDDFNSASISAQWESTLGPDGYWKIDNGEVEGSVVKKYNHLDTFSSLLAGDINWSNYSITAKLKGILGKDKKIMVRYQNPGTRYDVSLISGDGVYLQKWQNGTATGLWRFEFNNSNSIWYTVKVEAINKTFNIFVDGDLKLSVTDAGNPILLGKIGLQIWPGWHTFGLNDITTVRYDDILVTSIDTPSSTPTPSPTDTPTSTPTPTMTPTPTITPTPTPTNTPTPTPTPTLLTPIVILPGLGGSWNSDEIIHGQDQPQSEWYKPFFVNTYDGLVETLKNAGYELNNNLFVFYYDCFQPVEKSADDLRNYINNVVKPPSGIKINLVGHSLGGLVGRTYLQKNPSINKVNKLITLGTPHKGVVQAYKAWEGADLNGLLTGVEKIGAELLLQLRGLNYPNQVKAIQDIVPSFRDILFTENYLKNQNGTVKTESSLKQQNIWLKNLGISPETNNLTSTIVGTSINTPRWFKVQTQSLTDRILGRWEDGKPISQENSSGDKTVLEESAKINNANLVTLSGVNHGDLVKSVIGQQKILDILELTSSGIVPITDNVQEPALVFALASPAVFKVIAPDGKQIGENATGSIIPNALYSKDEKMIIISNYKSGKYQVIVKSFGEYKLLVGQLNSNNGIWTTFSETKSKNFRIDIDKSLKSTPESLLKQINSKLDQLISELPRKHPKSIFAGIIKMKLEKIQENLEENSDEEHEKKEVRIKIIEEAIKDMDNAIRFAQLKNINTIIPDLREITNLLAQAYDLLESNSN